MNNIKLIYHPTDADADIVADIIVKAVDEAILDFSAPESSIPKPIARHMEETGKAYCHCCSTDLRKIFGDEINCGLDSISVEPASEGGWGTIKTMSLEDYIQRISDAAEDNITSSGFIQYWLEDLKEYDKPSLAELMVKVNMRLIRNESVPYYKIKEQIIQNVYYSIRDAAFKD